MPICIVTPEYWSSYRVYDLVYVRQQRKHCAVEDEGAMQFPADNKVEGSLSTIPMRLTSQQSNDNTLSSRLRRPWLNNKMQHILSHLFGLALLYGASSAAPSHVQIKEIYQFPNETWVENLAVRSNGNLLVTLIDRPEVWEVNPVKKSADLLYTFPNALSACGIVEYAPDSFAINVGVWSDKNFSAVTGSWSVWSLSLKDEKQSVHKLADVPEAQFLNGIAILPEAPQTLLLADSGAGAVYSFNIHTGRSSTVIKNAALASNASVTATTIGVNGIYVPSAHPNTLYATNSFKRPTFFSVPISAKTGAQTGRVRTIVDQVPFATNLGYAADDFALDDKGYAWITADISNTLYRVSLTDGQVDVIAGSATSGKLAGITSCRFGRSMKDVENGRLYLTSNGGIIVPPPGGIVGGKVMAIDTAGL